MKRIIFTVTNDLTYDQRMIRICGTLAENGYDVLLVGRHENRSVPLTQQPFRQKRLHCIFGHGKLFYAEYNLRLLFFLLFKQVDCICAIDLDTILACYFASVIKRIPRVYDAHELFCEMKEVVTRPRVYRFWKRVERFAVPRFKFAYTVNGFIAAEFRKMYGYDFDVIQNLPRLKEPVRSGNRERYVIYQGAVNEGRSFETLIPAFRDIDLPFIIAGEGNFFEQCRRLVRDAGIESKVSFVGKLAPADLYSYTANAWLGVTLFENTGLSNYYSLANRFFDYIQAGVPQICVDYPAYREINKKYEVAVLLTDLSSGSISAAINALARDAGGYGRLQQNCARARVELNWEHEVPKLLDFYQRIFNQA